MNFIRELADQAGFIRFSPDEDPDTPIDWSSDYSKELEQFAKLIVLECARQIDTLEEAYGAPVPSTASKFIKKRFNVE